MPQSGLRKTLIAWAFCCGDNTHDKRPAQFLARAGAQRQGHAAESLEGK
jgi:hypothetical protein